MDFRASQDIYRLAGGFQRMTNHFSSSSMVNDLTTSQNTEIYSTSFQNFGLLTNRSPNQSLITWIQFEAANF
jgi:hypothetical protein